MQVKNYTLTTSTGRKVRTATKVILDDGTVISFMEKMSRRKAIRSAFTEVGRKAFTDGSPVYPLANNHVSAALEGNVVGNSDNKLVMKAFVDGWHRANLAEAF